MPDPTPYPLDQLTARGDAQANALVLKDRTLTFGDLEEGVALLAGWLADQVPESSRVASWATKGELTCLMPLAAARAGLVHVPINPLLKRAQVAHILTDSGASMLVGTPARLGSLNAEDVPGNCHVVSEAAAINQATALGHRLAPSDRPTGDLAAIFYTSGSTGKPKGVMLSHANLWLGAVSVSHYLGLAADDITLAVLPLSFDYGQNQLFSAWYAGSCAVPLDYLFARDVTKACAKHGITTLAGVPPLWVQLTEAAWPKDAVVSLRRITNSGGALTTELIDALRKKLPQTDIFPMYGLTEAFRSTYLDPSLVSSHPTSMGRAIPFAEIIVVDDAGQVSEAGQEGELVHCGPLVAQGYWQDEAKTKERFRPAPPESRYGGTAVWSGDRVIRDEDGLLYFVGRRDAMIKSAGNRISPQEIEDAARATGLVSDAVALGVPDSRLGQAIHLVVRPAAEAEHAHAALADRLKYILPNFMQPHSIEWRDALPTNPNGKIDRAALLEELSQ